MDEQTTWVAWRPGPRNNTDRPEFLQEDGSFGPVQSAKTFNDYVEAKRASGWPVKKWAGQPITLQAALDDDRYWQQCQIAWESWPDDENGLTIRVIDLYGGKAIDLTFRKFLRVTLTLVYRYKVSAGGDFYDGRRAIDYTGLEPASILFSPAQIVDAILSREGMLPEPSERRTGMYRPLWELEGEDER